jgi:transcriptional regulator with XRE-family HTH domain
LNLTQKELAKKVGYSSDTTIAKIEADINDLTQSKIVAFAEALETTPAYIMGWLDEKKPAENGELPRDECMEIITQLRQTNPALYRVAISQLEALLKIAKNENRN